MTSTGGRERAARVALAAIVAVFVLHRVLVALSVGDFLYPLEPSEGKHTQIAWDLRTGRFLSDGFGLAAYVSNSGSVHHGSYSTCALAYVVVSAVLGFDLLSVRATPLLFWAVGIAVLGGALRRTLGGGASILGALALVLVPMQFVALQLSFTGSHSESILPLALALAAWLRLLRIDAPRPRDVGLLGAALGYAVAFSYLLAPIVALMAAIALLPPRPRMSTAHVRALAIGGLLGAWPLLLILGLEPRALFAHSITENPSTTPLRLVAAGGEDHGLLWQTVRMNLPDGFEDYWMARGSPAALFGGARFEPLAWRIAVFGPLVLLPLALREPDAARRKLALLVAVAPPLTYLFLAFTTPWKPHIRPRYMTALLALGWIAPAVAFGLGVAALRRGARRAGVLAVGAALLATAWVGAPRAWEAWEALRLDRAAMNRQHRLVTYYNLGMGTIWAEDVPAVNDLVDVRSAGGDPRQFGGIQPALWSGGTTHGLGRGSFAPEGPLTWEDLASAIGEWRERQSYFPVAEQDDPVVAAENLGWGVGIRLDFDPRRLDALRVDAGGAWPESLDWARVWEGFGLGWGRIDPSLPEDAESLGDVPADARAWVARGIRRGRAIGAVPRAPIPPVFASVRGAAT